MHQAGLIKNLHMKFISGSCIPGSQRSNVFFFFFFNWAAINAFERRHLFLFLREREFINSLIHSFIRTDVYICVLRIYGPDMLKKWRLRDSRCWVDTNIAIQTNKQLILQI